MFGSDSKKLPSTEQLMDLAVESSPSAEQPERVRANPSDMAARLNLFMIPPFFGAFGVTLQNQTILIVFRQQFNGKEQKRSWFQNEIY
jgi:hypothetical protein